MWFDGLERPIKATTVDKYEVGFDAIAIFDQTDVLPCQPDMPTLLSKVVPAVDSGATEHMLSGIRQMANYVQSEGIELDIGALILNQRPCTGTYKAQRDPSDQAIADIITECRNYWSAVASPALDSSQLEALDKSLNLDGCAHLLQGPPGTGKTQTTVAMIDGLVRVGEKVMVTGPSHGSVDEAMKKAVASGRFAEVKMLRHFNQVLNSTQIRAAFRVMYDEEVLSLQDQRLIDMAVRSSYMDLKEASSLVRDSQSRTMAAWKVSLAQENSHGRLEPTAASLATRRSLAYTKLFSGEDLRGQAALEAKQEWGRADTALGLHVISFVQVVFATCNSAGHGSLVDLGWQPTVLFIDECGQATEPDVIVPVAMYSASLHAIFMGGDDQQLPPVVSSKGANEFYDQLSVSLFTRLAQFGYVEKTMLRNSYRFRPVHCLWSSREFYSGLLESGNHQDDDKVVSFQAWAQKTFTKITGPAQPRIAVDVGNDSRSIDFNGTVSVCNPYEAAIVIRAAASLIQSSANLTRGRIAATDIMILTPYTGQAMLLEQFAAAHGNIVDGIRICTVIQAQGG